jgi:hypothetical protein
MKQNSRTMPPVSRELRVSAEWPTCPYSRSGQVDKFRLGDNSEVNRRPVYNRLPSISLQRFISSLLGNDLSSTLRAVSTPAMGSPRGSRMPI